MFSKNNEEFTCTNCGFYTPEHPSSSRDHCSECLFGLHVDVTPGDRKNDCKGLLEPIGLKTSNQKEQVVYRCKSCGKTVFNITAPDDNRHKILELSNLRWS